jgi:hypothetical protein
LLRLSRSLRRNKESFEKTISILPFFSNINQHDFYWEVFKEGNKKSASARLATYRLLEKAITFPSCVANATEVFLVERSD